MSENYDLYPADGAEGDGDAGESARWHVVIEYTNRGQNRPPTVISAVGTTFATRDAALAEARNQAFSFEPPDPKVPQRRQVLRGTDGYLTIIEGAMTTFHFSTRVLAWEGEVS